MDSRIKSISVKKSASIISALRLMDSKKTKLLLVLDEDKFYSLLSIGDIQRAIIANVSLNNKIETILRKSVRVAKVGDSREQIIAQMKERRNEFMPVVDDDNNIVDIIFWEEVTGYREIVVQHPFTLPVIIMAGGQGTRLRPLTNVLPKPLIPLGEQTMVEDIMDRFLECGCHDFYLSVNYKADFIRQYLEGKDNKKYHIEYFQEDKPLGTAGSLYLLKDKIDRTFFVSNCDILIDEDYSQILQFHHEHQNEITVVAAIKNYSIPYGTLETGKEGRLVSLQEKPELTYKINTGMYILEPSLINEIPTDCVYHITYLIEKLVNEDRNVGVYPINEGSWIDVGNWDEYLKHIKHDDK